MFLYNVTINIEKSVEQEWLQWLRSVHIPDVLNTQMFEGARLFKLDNEELNEDSTYSIQYQALSKDHIEVYQKRYAKALQNEHLRRFRNKFVAFRTVLEQVNLEEVATHNNEPG